MPTPDPRKVTVLATGLVLVALGAVAGGCRGTDDRVTPRPPAERTNLTGDGFTTAPPASQLRARLTTHLQEHVYLIGARVQAATGRPGAGPDTDRLSGNSEALASLFREAYGPKPAARFERVWARHVKNLVAYGDARAHDRSSDLDSALDALGRDRRSLGELMWTLSPEVSARTRAEQLEPPFATLRAALDAVIDGRSESFAHLSRAASHMPIVANVLAVGLRDSRRDGGG